MSSLIKSTALLVLYLIWTVFASKDDLITSIKTQIDQTLTANQVTFGSSDNGSVTPEMSRRNLVQGLSTLIGEAEWENMQSLAFESKVTTRPFDPSATEARLLLDWNRTSSQIVQDFVTQKVAFNSGSKWMKRAMPSLKKIFIYTIRGIIAVPITLISLILKALVYMLELLARLFRKLLKFLNVDIDAAFARKEMTEHTDSVFSQGMSDLQKQDIETIVKYVSNLKPSDKDVWIHAFRKLETEQKALWYFFLARNAFPDQIRAEDLPGALFAQDLQVLLEKRRGSKDPKAWELTGYKNAPLSVMDLWARVARSLTFIDAHFLVGQMGKEIFKIPKVYHTEAHQALMNALLENKRNDLAYAFLLDWDHITKLEWMTEKDSKKISTEIKKRLRLIMKEGQKEDQITYFEYICGRLSKMKAGPERNRLIETIQDAIEQFHGSKSSYFVAEFEKISNPLVRNYQVADWISKFRSWFTKA